MVSKHDLEFFGRSLTNAIEKLEIIAALLHFFTCGVPRFLTRIHTSKLIHQMACPSF